MRRPLSLTLVAWWIIAGGLLLLWSDLHTARLDVNEAAGLQRVLQHYPDLVATVLPRWLGRIINVLTPLLLLLAGWLLLRGERRGRLLYVAWQALLTTISILAAAILGSTSMALLALFGAIPFLLITIVLFRPVANGWLGAAPGERQHTPLSVRRILGIGFLVAAYFWSCLGLVLLLIATMVHSDTTRIALILLGWLPFLILLAIGLALMPTGRSMVHAATVLLCASLACGAYGLSMGLAMFHPGFRMLLPSRPNFDHVALAYQALGGSTILLVVAVGMVVYMRRQPDLVF